jgi:hypothetical protein
MLQSPPPPYPDTGKHPPPDTIQHAVFTVVNIKPEDTGKAGNPLAIT